MPTSMKIGNPQRYLLVINKNKEYSLKGKDGNKTFTAPASQKGKPKLYTVSTNGKLHYVGITNQPMSTRLRLGLNAMGEHGYYGYKLKPGNYLLHVWSIENLSPDKREANDELETIEAEVVFLCRKETGRWPRSQNEIHFHPSNRHHRELAKRIYKCIKRQE